MLEIFLPSPSLSSSGVAPPFSPCSLPFSFLKPSVLLRETFINKIIGKKILEKENYFLCRSYKEERNILKDFHFKVNVKITGGFRLLIMYSVQHPFPLHLVSPLLEKYQSTYKVINLCAKKYCREQNEEGKLETSMRAMNLLLWLCYVLTTGEIMTWNNGSLSEERIKCNASLFARFIKLNSVNDFSSRSTNKMIYILLQNWH